MKGIHEKTGKGPNVKMEECETDEQRSCLKTRTLPKSCENSIHLSRRAYSSSNGK